MKLNQVLFEGPYHHDQDAPPSFTLSHTTISDNALKREYVSLGTLTIPKGVFSFWLHKQKTKAIVTTAGTDDIGQHRHIYVVEASFDNRINLPVKNQLQISKVVTLPDFRIHNLAMALYVLLVRYGYTIVSDFSQFNGGRYLWEKLARESDARKFAVRVWSDEKQDWIRGEDGQPVVYHGDNIPDDKIWHSVEDIYQRTSLLVLSHE